MRLVLTESIAAPVATVFHAFTDLAGAPDIIQSIQKIEKIGRGPVGKGTRFRETRIVLGRESTEEMEITAFEPKLSYTVEAVSQGLAYHTTYQFRGEGARTVVSMKMTCRPVHWKGWFTTPLTWIFAGSMRKMIAQDHVDLARVCEERVRVAAESA